MFEFIIGDIVAIKDDYIVLQNNNIGYKILTSTTSINDLEVGLEDVLIYTDLISRDDGIFLYGFISEEEIAMFRLLLLVSRVGPKVALGILSTLNSREITKAILEGDSKTLCMAPGIGKKTGERIILELKDRVDQELLVGEDIDNGILKANENINTAISALQSLGYTKFEIEKAMKKVNVDNLNTEDIIKLVLKQLSF